MDSYTDLPPERLEACLNAMIALKDAAPLHENADVEALWLRQILREWKQMRSHGPDSEAKIREDEARQIMLALDAYGPAVDYGPPIEERIALHSATKERP